MKPEGIKDNLVPFIANIDHAQEMYDALSKLFTTKNIGNMEILKTKLRTINMTKDDIESTLFVNITRIRDEILAIDEIMSDKELVMPTILGLPPT